MFLSAEATHLTVPVVLVTLLDVSPSAVQNMARHNRPLDLLIQGKILIVFVDGLNNYKLKCVILRNIFETHFSYNLALNYAKSKQFWTKFVKPKI